MKMIVEVSETRIDDGYIYIARVLNSKNHCLATFVFNSETAIDETAVAVVKRNAVNMYQGFVSNTRREIAE